MTGCLLLGFLLASSLSLLLSLLPTGIGVVFKTELCNPRSGRPVARAVQQRRGRGLRLLPECAGLPARIALVFESARGRDPVAGTLCLELPLGQVTLQDCGTPR